MFALPSLSCAARPKAAKVEIFCLYSLDSVQNDLTAMILKTTNGGTFRVSGNAARVLLVLFYFHT